MTGFAFALGLLALTVASQPTGRVSGRVLDEAGSRPLAGARVFLSRTPYIEGDRPLIFITNQDGEYAFENVTPGSYRLGTNRLGFLPRLNPVVHLVEGGSVGSIDLFMYKGGEVFGRILDERGPLRGVFVAALRVDGIARMDEVTPSVTTDRTNHLGEYRVQSLPPGRYAIVANAVSSGATTSLTFFPGTVNLTDARLVTVGTEETVRGVEFKLGTWPSYDVAHRPVVRARVHLLAAWPKFGGVVGSDWTDKDGCFRITTVIAGDYRVVVTAPGVEPTPPTWKSPFVPLTVVDRDVEVIAVLPPP